MNIRAQLALQLRDLARAVEVSTDPNIAAEAGIRLAEIQSWWARENLGFDDPLLACRDRADSFLALAV